MSGGSIGATTKSTVRGADEGQKVTVRVSEPCAGSGMPFAGNREKVRGAGVMARASEGVRRDGDMTLQALPESRRAGTDEVPPKLTV